MSLVQSNPPRDGKAMVFCPQCGQSIGGLTVGEIREIVIAGFNPLCFDCDPDEADIPPRHLLSIKDNYFLGIGNIVFLAEWLPTKFNQKIQRLQLHRISLATYFDIKNGLRISYNPLSSWSKSPQELDQPEKTKGF